MSTTLNKLKNLSEEQDALIEQLNKERAEKSILCSCGKHHKIRTLVVHQTHFYIEPHGCTEGDYWLPGELQFICPITGVRNRLLFDIYKIPYELRDHYDHNPEMQFKSKFKGLFKEIVDTYRDDEKPTPFVNNYYVDKHRKKFHLVEAPKGN